MPFSTLTAVAFHFVFSLLSAPFVQCSSHSMRTNAVDRINRIYTTDEKKIRGAVILYQLHPFIAPNRSLIFYAELKIKWKI